MPHPAEESENTPDRVQNQAARPGTTAAGDDAAQAREAQQQAEADDAAMRAHGFGDHKGASIDR